MHQNPANPNSLFRLIAWNIRAGGGRRAEHIAQALARRRADAVILSEFRSTPASQLIARRLAEHGLDHQYATTSEVPRGRNALLIAARTPLQRVALQHKPQEAGRWLMLRLQQPRLALAGMHIPNQHTGRKPGFHDAVAALAARWRGGAAILAGDTNSGRIGEDEETAVFNRRTHVWFDHLHGAGWRDAFRHLHGAKREYTWYSPGHDNGFRLDQAFLSRELRHRVHHVEHVWPRHPGEPARRDGLSDHAALIVDIDVAGI